MALLKPKRLEPAKGHALCGRHTNPLLKRRSAPSFPNATAPFFLDIETLV